MECCILYSLSLPSTLITQLSDCSFPPPSCFTSSGISISSTLCFLRFPKKCLPCTFLVGMNWMYSSCRCAMPTSYLQIFSLGLLIRILWTQNQNVNTPGHMFCLKYCFLTVLLTLYNMPSAQSSGSHTILSIPIADRFNLHKEFKKCLYKTIQFHTHDIGTLLSVTFHLTGFSFSMRKWNPRV